MARIIITLLIVLYRIPLINILGDKGMGYYSIALVIYLLLMTCIAYGLPKSVSTLIATQCSKGEYGLVYKTTKCSVIFAVISGGIFAILTYLGAELIATHIMSAIYSSYAIRAIAPSLLFISVLGALHGIYTGTRAVSVSKSAYRIEEFFVAVLSVAGAYIFTGMGIDIAKTKGDLLLEPAYASMGPALGLTSGVFIALIFSLILFINYRKKLKRMAVKDKGSVKESNLQIIRLIVKTMLPFILTLVIFHVSSLVDYAVFNRMMSVQGHKENSYIILLGMLNGKYEFFISIPLLFVNWYASSKVPMLTKVAKEANRRKIHIKISQYIRYTMLYIIPCTALFIIYSTPLMNLIFTGINETPSVMLKAGALSIVFYSLAAISNATLNALDDWVSVAKNALISLVVQIIGLIIMMIIFQWGIFSVVFSRTIFSAALFILNEHTMRERTGYVQEQKRAFKIPLIATVIMSVVSLIIYILFYLFNAGRFAIIIVLLIAIFVYILALVFLGGITQREMYRLPGGKYLAPLCKKLHLIK